MRPQLIILCLILAGCQGLPSERRSGHDLFPSVMPQWERYQACLRANEPAELIRLLDELDRVGLTGSEPPSWLKGLGIPVTRQPLRTSVDPHALSAACTIKAATVLAGQDRVPEARALYRRVLTRYNKQDFAYYHEQARDSLAALPHHDPAVVALHSAGPVLHAR